MKKEDFDKLIERMNQLKHRKGELMDEIFRINCKVEEISNSIQGISTDWQEWIHQYVCITIENTHVPVYMYVNQVNKTSNGTEITGDMFKSVILGGNVFYFEVHDNYTESIGYDTPFDVKIITKKEFESFAKEEFNKHLSNVAKQNE